MTFDVEITKASKRALFRIIIQGNAMKVVRTLTDGRPMIKVSSAFRDKVTGKMVFYWIDHRSRVWLSTSKWGWDRETPASLEKAKS